MFAVDEATANSIRRAYEDNAELVATIKLRRHFPLLSNDGNAWSCVLVIADWKTTAPRDPPLVRGGRRARPSHGP
ncbi:MAG: hypothetical protein ACRYG8_14860 [Janthinobacterium lividum]